MYWIREEHGCNLGMRSRVGRSSGSRWDYSRIRKRDDRRFGNNRRSGTQRNRRQISDRATENIMTRDRPY